MLWLRFFNFASDHETYARVFKLAAGTLAVIPAWCALGLIHASQPNGHLWLFAALSIVWAADSGAYFAGRALGGKLFGSRKLAPRISPNKTIEGLLGGLVAGVACGLFFASLAGMTMAQVPAVALVAVATVLFSVIGDLFESLLKRHVGAKDSGNLIPGHGGDARPYRRRAGCIADLRAGQGTVRFLTWWPCATSPSSAPPVRSAPPRWT